MLIFVSLVCGLVILVAFTVQVLVASWNKEIPLPENRYEIKRIR